MNPEQVKIAFLVAVFVSLLLYSSVTIFFRKKRTLGQNHRLKIFLLLICLAILLIPFWLAKALAITSKLIITFSVFAIGLFGYYIYEKPARKK